MVTVVEFIIEPLPGDLLDRTFIVYVPSATPDQVHHPVELVVQLDCPVADTVKPDKGIVADNPCPE